MIEACSENRTGNGVIERPGLVQALITQWLAATLIRFETPAVRLWKIGVNRFVPFPNPEFVAKLAEGDDVVCAAGPSQKSPGILDVDTNFRILVDSQSTKFG
jgi:hypothetical protein